MWIAVYPRLRPPHPPLWASDRRQSTSPYQPVLRLLTNHGKKDAYSLMSIIEFIGQILDNLLRRVQTLKS